MTRTHVKFMVAGVVLASAIGYLAWAGMKKGWATYHLAVDAYVAKPEFRQQRVRLAGRVADEGVVVNNAQLTARFPLRGETHTIPISYRGVVPDLFKPGCEVIVEGRLDGAGVFQADVLLTKCASKYEARPDSPGHPPAKTARPS